MAYTFSTPTWAKCLGQGFNNQLEILSIRINKSMYYAIHRRAARNTLQWSAVQCSAVQCRSVQYSVDQCNAVQYNAVRCTTVPVTVPVNFFFFLLHKPRVKLWIVICFYCKLCDKVFPLADRRENLITKFAIKTYNNPKFKSWFVKKEKEEVNTRSEQQFLKEVFSRTRRYESSTIPVITKIININYSENFRDTYCNICNYMFPSASNLSKHNKFKHSEETYIPEWNSRLMF